MVVLSEMCKTYEPWSIRSNAEPHSLSLSTSFQCLQHIYGCLGSEFTLQSIYFAIYVIMLAFELRALVGARANTLQAAQ
jgi:hypothetical protein